MIKFLMIWPQYLVTQFVPARLHEKNCSRATTAQATHMTKNTTHNTPQNTTPSLEGDGMSRDTEWMAEDLADPLPGLPPPHHNAR